MTQSFLTKKLLILLTCVSVTTLSACAVTTAGVKKGDERNFVRSVNDVSAERAIKARMRRAEGFSLKGVDVEVAEGIVLLSGNVKTPEDRIEAERIAWSAPRIIQVGNEVMLKDKQGAIRNTKDGLLNQSVRARLIADNAVKARNYNIEVHDGIVYLLGVARTPQELERATRIASTTRGTREVISYVTVHQAENANTHQYASTPTPGYSAPPVNAAPPTSNYRSLPQGLTSAPTLDSDALPDTEPYYLDPRTGERIELPPGVKPIPFVPDTPGSLGAGAVPPPGFRSGQAIAGQSAPARLPEMGDQLGKAFPSDDNLGAYRSGAAGEAVSIIESEPYYIDPDTGKEIPISFIQGR